MQKEIRTTTVTLKFWPAPQDYNEAVQNPAHNLGDEDLQAGEPQLDKLGIPRPITGGFASVYRLHCPDRDWAVRCFLHDIPDQGKRYELISNFVQHDDLPSTVSFQFINNGIKVSNLWFPLLKMEWVDGVTLDTYVHSHLGDKRALSELAKKFAEMCDSLHRAGIAHGDLQHGNIMVSGNELRLVDYDGMYVPEMKGYTSNELGHRNYQHPGRNAEHFGPYLDNFSAWVIYTSLKAIAVDPDLYAQLGAGDDCLLFRQSDFLDPLNSCAFAVLEEHSDLEVRSLARFIRWQLQVSPENVPFLDLAPIAVPDLPPLAANSPRSRKEATARLAQAQAAMPDWLKSSNAKALQTPGSSTANHQAGVRSTPTASRASNPAQAASHSSGPPVSTAYLPKTITIAPELLAPGPREVRFNPRITTLVVTITLAAALMLLFFVMIGAPAAKAVGACWGLGFGLMCSLWGILRQRQLIMNGTAVRGNIVEKIIKYNRRYILTYSFCRPEYYNHKVSRIVRREMIVEPKEYEQVEVGDAVTVIYDPADRYNSTIYEFSNFKVIP
jgi:serine/threonine protein kinase